MQRRENEKRMMIDNIQKATIDIINEEGYEQLSIRKIATRIDYSPTNIYNYFKNKGKIIESIIVMKSKDVIAKVEKKLQANNDKPFDIQFEIFVETFVKEMLKEPQQVQAVIQSGYNIFANYTKDEANSGSSGLGLFMQLGIETKKIRSDISESSVILIMTSLLGLISMIVNEDIPKQEIDLLIEEEIKLLWNGVKR